MGQHIDRNGCQMGKHLDWDTTSGPGYPPVGPVSRKKRRIWPWLVLGLGLLALCGALGVAVLGAGAAAVDEQIQHGDTALLKHVRVTQCQTASDGFTTVGYEVTNVTDRTHSYLIVFAITDDQGVRVGEAHAGVNDLAAGQKARGETISADVGAGTKCTVERVN